MVAPINATASIDAGGETITLTLNFATLDAARRAGADFFAVQELHPLEVAKGIRCLAAPTHPDFTDELALALVAQHGEAVGEAMAKLFEEFGGGAEGNAPAAPAAKPGRSKKGAKRT